jgi:hypothetical protein
MDKDKEREIASKIASAIVKKEVTSDMKKRAKKKALKALSIQPEDEMKIGAALAIGKAVAEKRVKMKVHENVELELDANKGRERFAVFFKKGF